MALDDLPGTLETPSRDDIATAYRRDYRIVSPESDTSDGTQPDVQAKTLATTLLPVYSDCVLVANGINEDAATGKRLDKVGARYGVTRPIAAGASGYVVVSAAAGGGTIQAGDELKNPQSGKRYHAVPTQFVQSGDLIRVIGTDTGPATNINGGSVLQWSSPRPGIGQTAVVSPIDALVPLGAGLTGGADVADDAAYLKSIQSARRNPPNASNDAQIMAVVRATPGLAVEAVFTYPCLFGPGTLAFAFTLPSPVGTDPAIRIPNTAQITTAYANLVGQLDGDDSYFALQITNDGVSLAFQITWDPTALGWIDVTPWPQYQTPFHAAGTAGAVVVASASSPTSFVLSCDNGDYTAVVQPTIGQFIGFWDQGGLVVRKKQIATVAGTGPWTVTTQPTTDTTYQPSPTQRAMPWSDSLNDLVPAVLAYMRRLGPGELFASFSSDGRRQRRSPRPPKLYPQSISNDILLGPFALPSVANAVMRDGLGVAAAVGVPGISVDMLTPVQITFFPL